MKRYIIMLALLCAVFTSCNSEYEQTIKTTSVETEAIMLYETTVAPTTEEVTVVTTATEIATSEVVETTAATTAATTNVTTTAAITAATAAAPKPAATYSAFVPSVLDGEYTYGGEPIIENIDGFTYVNGILIVNKTYPLPESFNPNSLHPDAKEAFDTMKADAAAEGITLKIVSGYRPYSQQASTYKNYSSRDGQAVADRYSARPGHSEHQSGFAMDINSVKNTFADSKEGIWLAANCAEYGFVLRYPAGKEEKTGYMYEPWHIRYIGAPLAKTITESGLCLEEFLNITSAYSE
ncbi:MAG: M15 family metallopeptidase [Clostridia bacterium]|nr:M15 family metallopeptidase [Clostridia bacterium]